MQLDVDFEKHFTDDVLSQYGDGVNALTPEAKVFLLYEWEEKILVPVVRNFVDAANQILGHVTLDQMAGKDHVVIAEISFFYPHDRQTLLTKRHNFIDYIVPLPMQTGRVPPILNRLFPPAIYQTSTGEQKPVRIVRPVLTGLLTKLIEEKNFTITAVRPPIDKISHVMPASPTRN